MLMWVSLALFVFLGVSRAIDGVLGVDVVALVFGDMSAATRVIYASVGVAAVCCAIALALIHPDRERRDSLRRADR
jgi:uncharacterized membrane protein YuzA (DUF378 family)